MVSKGLLVRLEARHGRQAEVEDFLCSALPAVRQEAGTIAWFALRFGRGHPWSHPAAGPVDYAVERFPQAQRHCDTHTGMTTPLRYPNGAQTVDAVAAGFRKVLENLDQLDF